MWKKRQVEHSYAGATLKIWITDPIAQDWYDSDWGEPREITFLREAAARRGSGGLRPGATVFDLGAHQSVVAMILGRRVAPGGKVVALEACRRNADLGRSNIANNAQSDLVNAVWAAAGATDGHICFENGFNGEVSSGKTLTSGSVPMRSVDSLAREHGSPAVVFIDVEGFELEVLKGSTMTLTARRTDFFVEVHSRDDLAKFGASASQVVATFPLDAFDLHAFDPSASPEPAIRPISDCSALVESGARFYLLATWK